jgi:hypothetical protein
VPLKRRSRPRFQVWRTPRTSTPPLARPTWTTWRTSAGPISRATFSSGTKPASACSHSRCGGLCHSAGQFSDRFFNLQICESLNVTRVNVFGQILNLQTNLWICKFGRNVFGQNFGVFVNLLIRSKSVRTNFLSKNFELPNFYLKTPGNFLQNNCTLWQHLKMY